MTTLTFEITDAGNPTMKLKLEDGLLRKTWETVGPSPLVHAGGKVKDEKSRLTCLTEDENETVIDLLSAFWESEVGDQGNVDCLACTDCEPRQVWTLVAKS